ncbi:hypothetical protein IS481_06410 [Caldimonas thermodepolymerans]|jgi:hypothetical protein|uniref:Uncharacterized protein n=1 Tax=Caldimonas thermodepolymerans TaxID=215580 RepID=A0A2S5T3C8_9BURK|nr:hypothetical protein [Caldimonas thermodepolymerans]PPE69429.1 hypothetical protein C1702_12075 [Caldimonas thermodepolymerans]QPC32781.1 hypothetical protein IS481_06410 [Caldimonas thermodepolymerans]RDI03547.1 hypothetical protein DES46_101229 [Caldimonas thermodepolymerans]TCP09457.1 hypothetical protein EV676_10130 [Caldimonas thermodepolymerans]UZG45646.1 hypothetical protein ONZ46_06765 [Caldimonas thermodepolymerans]
MERFINTSIRVGKYLISPLSREQRDGRHAASVSIRSGTGSATHDRVLRLVPVFDTQQAALRYATEQGLQWIAKASVPYPH